MAEKTSTKKRTTAKRTSTSNTGFTADERAAMKERAKELKAEAAKADGEKALHEKIAELKGAEKAMATRLHEIVMAADPSLAPKTWYGMPAWAKDGQLLCFFQPRGEVRRAVRDVRLQRRGEARSGRDVADLVGAEGTDPRRREEDHGAGQEGGPLRTDPVRT